MVNKDQCECMTLSLSELEVGVMNVAGIAAVVL